jgi:hypothetical protein
MPASCFIRSQTIDLSCWQIQGDGRGMRISRGSRGIEMTTCPLDGNHFHTVLFLDLTGQLFGRGGARRVIDCNI